MNIIGWVVLGLVAGAIAKMIYPGSQGGGLIATMVLGIVGAFIGGYVSIEGSYRFRRSLSGL